MSNSYFRFKSFTVEQDRCGMKVSTDACIQGAYAPVPPGVVRVLDVGAGTGLLSLMLAQRFPGIRIDAIEADEAAAGQAAVNVQRSPFAGRIGVIHGDARTFQPAGRYDFMICNPPFFSNSLKGPAAARNQARHDESLTRQDLMALMQRALRPEATACFLWPAAASVAWEQLLDENSYCLTDKLYVRDRNESRIGRIITTCSLCPQPGGCTETTLVIKDEDGRYSADFTSLLQPFYLHL